MAGLNDIYATIGSNIIMKKTVTELGEIYNLLDQDYSQRSIGTNSNTSTVSAFNVTASYQFSVIATNSYHNNANQNNVLCSHCDYIGHTIEKCYKIHGYPPGFKHKTKIETSLDKPS